VFATLEDVLLDVRIEDQDHSARVLREGVVLGAVTTERHPVPGCRVQPLQVKRYVPVAAPAYVERYLSDGFSAHRAATAPCVAWNRDDGTSSTRERRSINSATSALVAACSVCFRVSTRCPPGSSRPQSS
jgi:LysR family transcriptional regulator (chromosome initiation inhibitor)